MKPHAEQDPTEQTAVIAPGATHRFYWECNPSIWLEAIEIKEAARPQELAIVECRRGNESLFMGPSLPLLALMGPEPARFLKVLEHPLVLGIYNAGPEEQCVKVRLNTTSPEWEAELAVYLEEMERLEKFFDEREQKRVVIKEPQEKL